MRINTEAKFRHHVMCMRLAWNECLSAYGYGGTRALREAMAHYRYHEAAAIGFASISGAGANR
jgi:hypothetical protein